MYKKSIREYLEGRGSLADVERAIAAASDPQRARADAEKALAFEWEMKSIFAAIPAPPSGLVRIKNALREAPAPAENPEEALDLLEIKSAALSSFAEMPEPAGGFNAAISRMKSKLAAAPKPVCKTEESEAAFDICPNFDEQPERKLVLVESSRKKGVTRKIIGLPKRDAGGRDVLAAGKDLDE